MAKGIGIEKDVQTKISMLKEVEQELPQLVSTRRVKERVGRDRSRAYNLLS